jgi:hypothetical protein
MIKRAVWVHGNAVVAERPGDLAGEVRIGWGSKFLLKPGSDNWFHVSIPTPVLIDGVRPKLSKVFVLFATSKAEGGGMLQGSSITALHVYDGAKKVKSFGETRMGKHTAQIDAANTWAVDAPLTIYYGLGLSIHARAPQVTSDDAPQPVEFATIGADFI